MKRKGPGVKVPLQPGGMKRKGPGVKVPLHAVVRSLLLQRGFYEAHLNIISLLKMCDINHVTIAISYYTIFAFIRKTKN